MKIFVKFTENNDHEGETWYFWLQLDENREQLKKLLYKGGISELFA